MKNVLLLCVAVCFAAIAYGQKKEFSLNPWGGRNGVQLSVGFINHFEGEVSYIITSRTPTKDEDWGAILGFQSISTGLSFAHLKEKAYLGPKVYYQMTFVIFAGQVGFDYLSDFKGNNQARFTPKIGLSLFGYASVLYGRNYALGKAENNGLTGKGMLNLQIQIPFGGVF